MLLFTTLAPILISSGAASPVGLSTLNPITIVSSTYPSNVSQLESTAIDDHESIPKYNNTDTENPGGFPNFVDKRSNSNVVREDKWNVTQGYTDMFYHREEWQKILDKVVTLIMTFNVVGLMFGMGCAINLREVISNLWPPIGIIIGMCGQFIFLPATAFGFSILFKLKPYEALGCLVVSCSPGGTFSNFFTYWVEGDLALSVVMTACSSLIAFVGMPFNLWLYSSYYVGNDSNIIIPYLSILRALGFICGPVILGMILRHFSEKIARIITRVTSIIGYIGFLIVLTSWGLLYWEVFTTATPYIYASAVILPATGFTIAYIVAYLLGRPHKVCRTIGIETGSQNMPVALSIILLSFENPEIRGQMLLFPTLYGIFMLAEVFLGIGFFRGVKYCRAKEKQMAMYPQLHTATIESGMFHEKEKLRDNR